VPDDLPRPAPLPGGPQLPVDFVDLELQFAASFPGLLDGRGKPLSWRHFIYGLDTLGRLTARESIRLAGAFGIAQTPDPKAAAEWYREQKQAAGWET
jgi:hypothetical protein